MALETDERKREFQRSIVTTRAILKGEMFCSEDLTFKRPGTGVAPEFVDFVIGRVAKRDLNEDELLKSDDF